MEEKFDISVKEKNLNLSPKNVLNLNLIFNVQKVFE